MCDGSAGCRSMRSLPILPLAATVLAACGGGGGGAQSFRVESLNLSQGQKGWELNRVVRVVFNDLVDPASVTNNTVQVRLVGGSPAFGTPGVDPADPRAVLWRPLCPTKDDLSDAGLSFGVDPATGAAYAYELKILGADSGKATLRSMSGEPLSASVTRFFSTPVSTLYQNLFVDDVVGPPLAVVRDAGSTEVDATRVSIGGVDHYLERQMDGTIALQPPVDLPLNLLSDPSTRVVLLLQLDQSVDMRSSNIDQGRVRLEFEAGPDDWRVLASEVELLDNCTESGALLSIEPRGLLPPAVALRGVIEPAFRDIVGQTNILIQDQFAPLHTEDPPPPPQVLTDEYLEVFADDSNEDGQASFPEPRAEWGGGRLRAKFGFTGKGGPGGNFDWEIATGQSVIVNTFQANISGGPGFVATTTEVVVGGVIDVRHLLVEDGAVLKFEGPNPVRIVASGDVVIRGIVTVEGSSSIGVQATKTTHQPEPGAPGQAGGGRGGTGSYLTSASTPRGENGFGAFNTAGAGGQGGEAGWAIGGGPTARRGAGGGGGRLGVDVPQTFGSTATYGLFDQTRIGLDGEPGFDNPNGQFGVYSGPGGPIGGTTGPLPFFDSDPGNDFFGTMYDAANGRVVLGELKTPWAGAGGGAGGDASTVGAGSTYPPPFKIAGDEKGAGGGGGGGSLHILALGTIRLEGAGRIVARGGSGGGGENQNRFNRVGGGSGGGSGGHVVLEAGTAIDLSGLSAVAINATGGQGGAGRDDLGGSFVGGGGSKETNPKGDACPAGYPTQGTNACKGHVDGAGGDGGPGIVQLHTSTGTIGTDILLPPGMTLADLCLPPPLCAQGSGQCFMIPTFGRRSRARSQWIALGEGGFTGGTPPAWTDPVFEFGGTDPVTGLVLADPSGTVLPGRVLLSEAAAVVIGYTHSMDASALLGGPDEYLLHQPELMRRFLLELRDSAQPTHLMRFSVVDAAWAPAAGTLTLTLDGNGPQLESFQSTGPVTVDLQQAFFRVSTDQVPDVLPPTAAVSIRFEATEADANGAPQENPVTVPLTADVGLLNFPGNRDLRFVRFEVLFDVDALVQGLSPQSPIPATSHLRLPFRY